ncbi:MAG: PEP-CTERM sorting domain-containing protein [Candidatus Eisenbacteria bacterium]|uniref:PEP-CTERM sorting domain-containing protein n=1 Tax=Eiseniibacteriota bacterium TaxID=2212470 RepID=A0A7Y2H3L7_UNCEI|nr:PEP-CTERM sorting domain-containing protein [Candidatus Eisenbacteria bacterium]
MKKHLLTSLTGLLLLALTVAPASANLLSIQFSGLNLTYDHFANGGTLAAPSPFALSPDPLATMNFFNNGSLVGTLTQDIAIGMSIGGLGPITTSGGTYFGHGGGFGLRLYTNNAGDGITLNWDSPVQVNVNPANGGAEVSVLGSASTSAIIGQSLPFGFELDAPVQVSFSTQISDFDIFPSNSSVGADTYKRFEAFGTGEVSGNASPIPEPLTLLTFGLGLAGLGAARRKRK